MEVSNVTDFVTNKINECMSTKFVQTIAKPYSKYGLKTTWQRQKKKKGFKEKRLKEKQKSTNATNKTINKKSFYTWIGIMCYVNQYNTECTTFTFIFPFSNSPYIYNICCKY